MGEAVHSRIEMLEDQLRSISLIGSVLADGGGLKPLFKKVVPHVSRLLKAERTTLFLFDPRTDQLWSQVSEGADDIVIRLEIGRGVAGSVAHTKELTNIPDAYQDSRFNPAVDKKTGFRTKAILCTPLLDTQNNLLGVLQVLNKVDGSSFGGREEELLSIIGTQVSYVVANANLTEAIVDQNYQLAFANRVAEKRKNELDLLHQLEEESARHDNTIDLLQWGIETICGKLFSYAGSIAMFDTNQQTLSRVAAHGVEITALNLFSIDVNVGFSGWVAYHKEGLVSNTPQEDTRFNESIYCDMKYPVHAIMVAPIADDSEVYGTIEVMNPRPSSEGVREYTVQDLTVLKMTANKLALLLARLRERQAKGENDRLVAVGRMLAGVAHDLRNPMSVVSGYSEIIAIEENSEKRGDLSRRILLQVNEMGAMINDLLAFSKGDSSLSLEDVAIEELASQIRESLEPNCKPRKINFTVEFDEANILIDPGKIKRVILNLGKNATEVLRRKGELTISLRAHQGGLKATVFDNGPGIPQEIRDQLFKEFVTSGKESGTGLGLSIAKRFVDDHNGSIDVYSVTGEGTTFTIVLPKQERA